MTDDPTTARLNIFRNGYTPHPCIGKVPVLPRWPELDGRVTEAMICAWPKECKDATNTGVPTAHTPAIDVDITNPILGDVIAREIADWFDGGGVTLVRVGRAPRFAIPLQTAQPFAKQRRIFRDAKGIKHKIEVLCDGQQFIGHGTHPDTSDAGHTGAHWRTPRAPTCRPLLSRG